MQLRKRVLLEIERLPHSLLTITYKDYHSSHKHYQTPPVCQLFRVPGEKAHSQVSANAQLTSLRKLSRVSCCSRCSCLYASRGKAHEMSFYKV